MSGVICSGPQNSGTYLLTKCVELMGFERLYGNIDEEKITANQWDRPNISIKDRIWDEPYKGTLLTFNMPDTLEWLQYNLLDNHCIHAHSPQYIEGYKNVFILRDPRNILLSRLRRRIIENHPILTRLNISPNYSRQTNFFKFISKFGESFVNRSDKYFQINRGFRVYYESLKHPITLRNLAKYLETDKIPTIEELKGRTITWSGQSSNYKKWWSEKTELLFESIGGNDLVRRMGYEFT